MPTIELHYFVGKFHHKYTKLPLMMEISDIYLLI